MNKYGNFKAVPLPKGRGSKICHRRRPNLRYIFLMSALFLAGCGASLPQFEPLEKKMFKVENISPQSGEMIGPDGRIVVKFSRRLDRSSVGDRSIFVMRSEDLPADISKLESLDTSSLNSLQGVYLVSEDDQAVEYQPEGGFQSEGEYKIIINGNLCSEDGIPVSGGKGPFTSAFYVSFGPESSASSEGGGGEEISSSDGNGGASSSSGQDEEDVAEGDKLPAPAYLLINEVYYDPSGPDTNGDVFIELYGEPGGSLEGYHIVLVNGGDGKTYKDILIAGGNFVGDDGLFVIADTSAAGSTNVRNANLLENFDPQNGPDTIQLLGPDNKPADIVGYGKVTIAVAQNGLPMYANAPAPLAASGMSLSRIEGAEETGDNSVDLVVNTAPSPGSFDVLVK